MVVVVVCGCLCVIVGVVINFIDCVIEFVWCVEVVGVDVVMVVVFVYNKLM